jgi:hypothetical protein
LKSGILLAFFSVMNTQEYMETYKGQVQQGVDKAVGNDETVCTIVANGQLLSPEAQKRILSAPMTQIALSSAAKS